MQTRRFFLTFFCLAAFRVCAETSGDPLASLKIGNLPDAFYRRPGLEKMPRVAYEQMPVVNVRDEGAKGDGVADERRAFDRALDRILQKGGGVLFIPKGVYTFHDVPGTGGRIWNIARPGRDKISNVHFVGEGEGSIIRFTSEVYDAPYGWNFGNVENVTLRDLSFTAFPYFHTRGANESRGLFLFQFGSYKPGEQFARNIELVNVSTDQGVTGPLFRRGADGVWIVDCKVRNTSADGIHLDTAQRITVAYNQVEFTGDDALANISVAAIKNPALDNRFLFNTALASQCRGIALGGLDTVASGNWFEQSQLSAIYLHAHGHRPVEGDPVSHPIVSGNTVVRCNIGGVFGSYPGALLGEFNVSDAEITGNKILGCGGDGIAFRVYPTALYPTGVAVRPPERIAIEDNIVCGNSGCGVELLAGTRIDGLTVANNVFHANAKGSILLAGIVSNASFRRNTTDHPPVVGNLALLTDRAGGNASPAAGFQPGPAAEVYPRWYADIAAAPDESEPLRPPSPPGGASASMRSESVRMFGARGDGRTDDTGAFTRALAALPPEGGVLEVPAGSYLLRPPAGGGGALPWTCVRHHLAIVDRANIHLRGEGRAELLFDDPDAQGLRLIHVRNASVTGLAFRLRSQPPLRHDRALLDLSACSGVALDGLTLEDSSGPGIQIDASREIGVTRCTVSRAGTDGVAILSSSRVLVENCALGGARDDAVRLDVTGGVTRCPRFIRILNNRIQGVREGFGVALCGGDEVEVSGNAIADCYQAGVAIFQQETFLPWPRALTVSGNTLARCNRGPLGYTSGAIAVFSVQTAGAGDFRITGNTIEDTPKYAVSIERAKKLDRVTIQANTVRDAKLGAIGVNDQQKQAIHSLVCTP